MCGLGEIELSRADELKCDYVQDLPVLTPYRQKWEKLPIT